MEASQSQRQLTLGDLLGVLQPAEGWGVGVVAVFDDVKHPNADTCKAHLPAYFAV